jgi:hypothetical protein
MYSKIEERIDNEMDKLWLVMNEKEREELGLKLYELNTKT